jgi:hypothetical protein
VAKLIRLQAPDGKVLEGEEVGFKPEAEPWCVYQLEDGHTLRLKLVLTQVIRTPQKDADGNPVYVARSSNVIAVSPVETYRKDQIH